MAQTPTRKNDIAYTPTAMSAKVDFTPTFVTGVIDIVEDEANCKSKFHIINAGGTAMATDITDIASTITPLNANVAKIGTNTTAIQASLAAAAADRIAYQVTGVLSNATGEITNGIPAGYEVTSFYFRNTTASTTGPGNPVSIKVGTGAGGEQIMAATNITSTGSSVITEATVVAHSATAAARTIYVSAGAWDGAAYTVDYIVEKVLY